MVKSKGGKGKKADYRTQVVRVPEPVLAEVLRIIKEFHEKPEELPEELPTVIEPTYVAKVAQSLQGIRKVDLRFK